MEEIRKIAKEFITTLTSYDYASFGLTFFIFVLFLILALMLRHRIKLSAVLVFLSFFSLFAGPVIMHMIVKSTLFRHDANVTVIQKLVYSDTLLIKGELQYLGKNEATHCEINAEIYKKSDNFFRQIANSVKMYKRGYTIVDFPFAKGDKRPFKVVVEPFNYTGEFDVKLDTDCFQ